MSITRTLLPTSNTTPDQGGTLAVDSPTNTGHTSTTSGANVTGLAPSGSSSASQAKSCRWSSFQPAAPAETVISLRLKLTWAAQGSEVETPASDGSADATATYLLEYSLNGGSSWTTITSQAGTFNSGASENIVLLPTQSISQIQVRDRMDAAASAVGGTVDNSTAVASSQSSVSGIELELITVNHPSPILIP